MPDLSPASTFAMSIIVFAGIGGWRAAGQCIRRSLGRRPAWIFPYLLSFSVVLPIDSGKAHQVQAAPDGLAAFVVDALPGHWGSPG